VRCKSSRTSLLITVLCWLQANTLAKTTFYVRHLKVSHDHIDNVIKESVKDLELMKREVG